ncbi:DUF58 domain-containing protein [Laspinema palackyanum]|uniref:DUF58 domain-containing protein n=1 Tax=Laspinema palackyanum TaxID=3231601 RepID=UPI00345D75F0|nr:DUF58 domain-containing protein [Laspinema sp. D2c]
MTVAKPIAARSKKTRIPHRIANWLETHWVTPAYAGWLLLILAIFFFGAATNTMAGWLYVISGVSFALLGTAAILPVRSLRDLQVQRATIEPVSAGEDLTLDLAIANQTAKPKTLVQVEDLIPFVLGKPMKAAIEEIPPNSIHHWVYYYPTQRRGIYRWHEVQLRSATPLGLFWCRRSRQVPAMAVVYPQVLPLSHCPLVDRMGQEDSLLVHSDRRAEMASEGITRTVRPYRYGDPTRLIHWRSSARFGELRVRELEVSTGGQEVIIALDSGSFWNFEDFEAAVIAAASLYCYAERCQLNVRLWTAGTGLVHGNNRVLEALAATQSSEKEPTVGEPPFLPLIWLTQNSASVNQLPRGSRWVFWPSEGQKAPVNPNFLGIEIQADKPLQLQLQSSEG